ncbi:MAG: hypothetical protein NC405_04005 [Odoribacter sp.]|nr:hypothetical protein [Odoribacter sp.]
MEQNFTGNNNSLRYGMIIPLVLMIASLVSSCLSYSDAKQSISEDLNDAMIALADKNRELWTRKDTISALRQMHEMTHKPLIYQASDVNFRNSALKDDAYFTITLVDKNNGTPKLHGDKIASDSIMIVPENAVDGFVIQLQGFADYSIASVFSTSDQTLPGVLFSLSILSMASIRIFRRKEYERSDSGPVLQPLNSSVIDGIKLTPMQRQFTRLLLDAPACKVDKATLCAAMWGDKINADESLYTLVRRTKTALADTDIEIICNRGDSYELRIRH